MKKQTIIIFLTVFIDLIGFGIIIPLSPFLARDFGANAFDVGLLMSIYSIMQFIFSPIWGNISDRIGRKPIILMSLMGSCLAHLMFAFSSSFWLLFIARAFAGICGASVSTAMAYMADTSAKDQRSKAMALIGVSFGLGFILGPLMGGVFATIGQSLGDTPPFGHSFAAIAASGLALVNFLFASRYLTESLPPSMRGEAIKQSVFSRIGLIKKYVCKKEFSYLLFFVFCIATAMAHMEASLFLFVEDKFLWDLKTASKGFAYVGVVMIVTQGYFVRKWLPKLGEKLMLVIGTSIMASGLIGISISEEIPLLAISVTLMAVGYGLVQPTLSGSVSLTASEKDQGSVMGVSQSLSALGRIVGPISGGWVYKNIGIERPFLIAGCLVFLVLSMALTIYDQLPSRGKS